MHVIGGVEDPELKKPQTELDMIKSVSIEDGNVQIDILLIIPGCPLKEKIASDVTEAVEYIPGVSSRKGGVGK